MRFWVARSADGREPTRRLAARLADTGRDGYRRSRTYLIVAVRAGLAATLSRVPAREILGDPEPTFAPAAPAGWFAAPRRGTEDPGRRLRARSAR